MNLNRKLSEQEVNYMVGTKVKHLRLGKGEIIAADDKSITVKFAIRTMNFVYPDIFETFLKAEDEEVQASIMRDICESKKIAEQKRKDMEAERQAEKERQQNEPTVVKKSRQNNIDELFSDDYNVAHLARQPILTYQQVEEQFDIKISGFGRGINLTPSTIVLVSSIKKSGGNFVYHDKWTPDGDYIYSGEGKNGDQSLTRGNLAIKNAEKDNKTIHLFVKFSPQEYYYQGVFKLVDCAYEDDKDEDGNLRKEYKFRLRKA